MQGILILEIQLGTVMFVEHLCGIKKGKTKADMLLHLSSNCAVMVGKLNCQYSNHHLNYFNIFYLVDKVQIAIISKHILEFIILCLHLLLLV
jgi:hypothetical protein